MEWQPIESAPKTGKYRVRGGMYDSAYSQDHGMAHDEDHEIVYIPQLNPNCDPPYRLAHDVSCGIKNPTRWQQTSEKSQPA